jgi:hypothetical protein
MSGFQIGWYTVPDDEEYTDRGYECAAWYKTIMVKAGKYPVIAEKFFFHERDKVYTNQINDTSIRIRLDGIVTKDDFAGRFCGSFIGIPKFNRYAGEESFLFLRPYAHATAKEILEGTSNIELLPDFEAQEIHFTWNDESHISYGIFKI